ncbi:MAG: vanadium-dependent haloperoxidase [Mucilaginibacter polytrichastri]|nr:vanadium-dependent haloperoxidase [Mucilaginibacter polytrichastri]
MVSHQRKIILLFFLLIKTAQLSAQKATSPYAEPGQGIWALSMVMLHDVVNPPAAARYYSYATLGAHEIVAANNKTILPTGGILKDKADFTIQNPPAAYDYKIAAYYCILETGKLMLPSGFQLQETEEKYLATLKKNKVKADVIQASVTVAEQMATKVVAYSKKDNYNKLSARLRYTPKKEEGFWYPTPPAYIEAVEPNWRIIRPMMLDTCTAFTPLRPASFSKDSTSAFYKLNKEVKETGDHLTPAQRDIAAFWDCNPFAVSTSGHMSIGFKKISPGGHWMNIAALAGEKTGLSFDKKIEVLTYEGIAIMDAFISCWDEKYRTNRIRPETYINRYMNVKWTPLLQTPPFPEYTSGHAVISNASAEVLSFFFGDNFGYTDDTETMFELKPRTFTSFRQAAAEASISRLYGGIHYRDACENGNRQGKAIGDFIVQKMQKAGVKQVR